MRKFGFLLAASLLFVAPLMTPAMAQDGAGPSVPIAPGDVLILELETGRVFIELYSDVAPAHAERIRTLATQGFYDDVIFHRVIDGFMAQTGDPTGTGRGGSDLEDLPAEFSAIPHRRGTVSMARSQSPDSANSQFFIMLADTSPSGQAWSQLDNNYTVFGRVVDGMDFVDAIAVGEPPLDPTDIVRARTVATDFPEVNSYPGPAQTPERIAAATIRAQQFDPLFETDVQIDILTPVLRTP